MAVGLFSMNQYETLCDNECGQVLHDNISIFVWNKGEEERTICEYCHCDIEDEMRADGWSEQGDDQD